MRTNSFIHLVAVCATLLAGLFSACSIYDDNSKCPAGTLHFSYTADGNSNVIGQYIDGATLYIFDANTQALAYQATLGKEELTAASGYRLPNLEPGNYKVVVWGNQGPYTRMEGSDRWSTLSVHTQPNAQGAYENNDALYYALASIAVGTSTDSKTEVAFHSAHIALKVHVVNFASIYGKGLTPVVKIENLGINYAAATDLSIRTSQYGTFVPQVENDESKHTHTANVQAFLFKNDNDVVISIYHPQTGERLESIALKDYLAQYHLSVEEKQENLVSVVVEISALGVIIRPPFWLEEEIHPEI